ncbi:MAG: elongation factor P [Fusobacteria bacterium]|nr:elongation factor P [Fusobacteriota bacterium]
MRIAQEFRNGNVIKMGDDAFTVLKTQFHKSGRSSAVVKFKLKNLITGNISETSVNATDKFDEIRLDRRTMQFLYENDGMYAFMDQETFDQLELSSEDLDESAKFLVPEMAIDVMLYDEKPVAVELPNNIERKVEYTEPGLRGDTSGRVTKAATIEGGYELQVPLFVNIGDVIRIDTRECSYMERVK